MGRCSVYTEPVTSPTGFKGKSPAADIYALIISDLTDAVQKLPELWRFCNWDAQQKVQPMLYWEECKCRKAIMLLQKPRFCRCIGKYSLVANYSMEF